MFVLFVLTLCLCSAYVVGVLTCLCECLCLCLCLCASENQPLSRNIFRINMFHLNMLVIVLFTLGVSFKQVSCLVCNLCGFTVLA